MAQEGIATLPQAPENQAAAVAPPDLEAIKQSIGKRMPGSMPQYDQAMNQLVSNLNLPPDQLQLMQQILQYILSHEQEYSQIRQKLISEGQVNPEDLPEQFDRGYLSTMMVVVQEALKRQSGAGPMAQAPQPQGFQKGGLAAAAQSLAAKGRGGDTILAHINPEEAMMLKAMGGSGTINPSTGIMEFKGGGGGIGGFVGGVVGGIGKAFSAVGDAVKSVASSPIGKIVMTVGLGMAIAAFPPLAALGPIASGAIAGALSSGAVSLAGGSNLKEALRSAAIGGAMGGIAGGVADFAQPAGWLQKGMLGAAMGTGYGLATGQNLGQALRTGAISGLTAGAVAGYSGDTMSANATPSTPANINDNSTLFGSDVNAGTVNTPTTGEQAVNITNQGGSITPTSEGISTLQTPDPYAVQDMQVQARSGEGILTANGQPAPVQGPAAYAGDQQYMNQDMQQQSRMSDNAILRGNQPSSIYEQGKDYLFGTDPKNPGMFMTKEGGYSIPAITAGVLGIGALTGGFDSSTPQSTSPGLVQRNPDGSPVTGENLVNQNPDKYVTKNIPNFNTSAPPPVSANYVVSPTYGTNRALPYATYMPPPGVVGGQSGQPIQQPYNTASMYNFMPRTYAQGGISQVYPRRTGGINGPGTGTSDSIPAMLSDGEFVVTAKAVRGAGNGSRREGAKKLYRMMHALEKKAK
jgi:hypothetical protein